MLKPTIIPRSAPCTLPHQPRFLQLPRSPGSFRSPPSLPPLPTFLIHVAAKVHAYPLPAVLTLAVAAILCNHHSLLSIAEWGAAQSPTIKAALGFPNEQIPHVSTLQRLFQRLDPAPLATTLTAFFDSSLPGVVRERGSQGIAIDGKAQRGRLPYETVRTHPIHAVSAMCHEVGVVLAQMAVDAQQHQAELTVVPALL